MSTLNLGKIRFNWTGAYNNSTAYVANDVVSSGGNSYICILASTGNAVSNATYWSLMAQGGTDLTSTLTTQGDILYRDGSGLQRLAKGTAGQQLAMNSGANAPEWITASGGAGTPMVNAYVSNQSISNTTVTTIIASTIQENTGTHGYNNSTGVWTCPSAGVWLYSSIGYMSSNNGGTEFECRLNTTGMTTGQGGLFMNNDRKWTSAVCKEEGTATPLILKADVGDTATQTAYHNTGSTANAEWSIHICKLG